jgi:hypothetical protein
MSDRTHVFPATITIQVHPLPSWCTTRDLTAFDDDPLLPNRTIVERTINIVSEASAVYHKVRKAHLAA